MLHCVVCVAVVFVTWSARNWLLHAIELCILTFLKRTKRVTLESVKNHLHLIEICRIQNWDYGGSKTHKTSHLRIRLVPFQMTFQLKLRSKVTETYWRTDWGLRITARPQDYSRRFKHFGKMTQFWEFLHERIITSIEIFEIHQHNSLKLEFVSSANENGFIWTFLFPEH